MITRSKLTVLVQHRINLKHPRLCSLMQCHEENSTVVQHSDTLETERNVQHDTKLKPQRLCNIIPRSNAYRMQHDTTFKTKRLCSVI